jgi:hypothetical protein
MLAPFLPNVSYVKIILRTVKAYTGARTAVLVLISASLA